MFFQTWVQNLETSCYSSIGLGVTPSFCWISVVEYSIDPLSSKWNALRHRLSQSCRQLDMVSFYGVDVSRKRVHQCCFARLESSVSLYAHLCSPSWARPLSPRTSRPYFARLAAFSSLRRKAAVLCRPGCPMGRKDLFETIVAYMKWSSGSRSIMYKR